MLLPPALNYLQPRLYRRPRADRQRSRRWLSGAAKRAVGHRRRALLRRLRRLELREAASGDPPGHRHPLLRPHGPAAALRQVRRQGHPGPVFRGRGSARGRGRAHSASGATTAGSFATARCTSGSACSIAARTTNDATIDAIFARIAGKRHVLVKADIEGAEYRVLPDLLRHRRRHRRPRRRVSRHRAAASGLRTSGRPAAAALRPRACARQQLPRPGRRRLARRAGDDVRQQAPWVLPADRRDRLPLPDLDSPCNPAAAELELRVLRRPDRRMPVERTRRGRAGGAASGRWRRRPRRAGSGRAPPRPRAGRGARPAPRPAPASPPRPAGSRPSGRPAPRLRAACRGRSRA